MSELRVSNELSLPKEAATWVFSYVAKRGAGKTYNAAVQAEEMLKANIPIVVIDGMGIWWGLRVSNDGKGTGFPIVVFGGEHADLPLNPEKAEDIAKAIVETNISCVLDLSDFAKYTARKIVTSFLNELYKLNRADRHIFIEEADLWAPQKPLGPEENLCLAAVDNFVRRGGNHNLGCTLITQRSAVLNKNILTQSDCLVILRTLAPQDKKAIQSWVEEQTDKDKSELNKWYDSLKTLENGEAYVWHPEKPAIFCKVKYRQRETFHATREFIKSPEASQIKLMDVGDFIKKFEKIFKIEKQPVILNGEISDPKLKEEIGRIQKALVKAEEERDFANKRFQEISEEDAKIVDALEAANHNLKATKALREAFANWLFPEGLPQPTSTTIEADNTKTSLTINHTSLQVKIQNEGIQEIQMSTRTKEGQMMYCIVNELPTSEEGWSNSELIDKTLEHGWAINKSTVSVSLSKWASSGMLIKTSKGYRLPKFVKFEVTKE